MSKSINNLSTPSGDEVYYDPGFCRFLESYLPLLRLDSEDNIAFPESHEIYKYEGDLFGLLDTLNIKRQYHWITMRINGFKSPTELDSNTTYLLTPKISYITMLSQKYLMIKK